MIYIGDKGWLKFAKEGFVIRLQADQVWNLIQHRDIHKVAPFTRCSLVVRSIVALLLLNSYRIFPAQ